MKKPIPFGKYVLLERINVGGMAEVFKAKAFGVEGFERLVAVKRILPSIAEDQEFITMFIDEAKIAVQLTHANVAQIFDLGKVTDSYFIAMEFVHGKDLRAIFDRARKRGETVPVPMACYTVMKVCEGLDYAHNKKDAAGRELNLVHRDVSPQNLLISYDGETKIIDFGIAKAAGKAGKTQAGILKGKFGYMSPEQVRGLPLDRRSDIFAMGIVLYELLTGERLFVGESDFSTLEKVRNVEIMPPSTYNRRIPEELEQIVLKSLAKDVDDRYQTAMDLHDDLQSFMYTSGNFFSRKDLSAYMRKAFAEEIAKESQREEEYRRLEAEAGLAAPAPAATGSSGLDAFADLEPAAAPAKAANISAARPRRPARNKRTMMGVGAVPPPPPRSSAAPPPPPRPSAPRTSAPPVPSPMRSSNPPPPPPPSSPVLASPGASLDMDWDDEELSTQIYDKPEDGVIPMLPDLSQQLADPPAPVSAPAPAAPFSPTASSPGAVPGMPSPFDDLPDQIVPASPREPTEVTRPAKEEKGGGGMLALFGFVAVLALGLIGAGGWWFFLRSVPGTINLATNPPDAVVYLDNEPITSSTSSPFVLAAVEPGEHLVEVRKHGFQTWATRVTLTSGQTLQLPEVTLVSESGGGAGSGSGASGSGGSGSGGGGTTEPAGGVAAAGTGFSLETVPSGATVFVGDNQLAQRTPVTVTDLAPGTHTIRAELDNYAPWTGQIEVTADRVTPLPRTVLTLRQVSVRFESSPAGARVTLVRGSERRRVGETPVTFGVDISGGQWTVEMSRAGYNDWSQPLNPPAGQASHTVTASLEERHRSSPRGGHRGHGRGGSSGGGSTHVATGGGGSTQTGTSGGGGGGGGTAVVRGGTGTLRVNTTPWSEVYVDGRRIGNTPQMNISLPAGRHSVRLINSEFNIRETVSVNIRAGQTETLIRRLTPGG